MARSPERASLLRDRWFLYAVVVAILGLYLLGVRQPYSTASCHNYAEGIARSRLVERVKANPDNKTYIAAAKANLYATEDYDPVFRKCMLGKGYLP